MINAARQLKVLGDATRLRIIHLIGREELTVTELGHVLSLPQPRISAHVAQIREVIPLTERRRGRRVFLGLDRGAPRVRRLFELLGDDWRESAEVQGDLEALERVLSARDSELASDPALGGLGRRYLPGRTWEGFARALLELAAPRRVVDVGVGEGEMTLLLSRFATELIAVDPDTAALNRLERKAERAGVDALEVRSGRLESLPLADAETDLVVISQVLQLLADPSVGLREAHRVLAPGGRVLVLDLRSHRQAWVRDRLGHEHLGFSEKQLRGDLENAGFADVQVTPVSRDSKAPNFVTLMAIGRKT